MTRYSQYLKAIGLFSDLLILNLCFVLAFYFKFGAFHEPFRAMLFYINFSWLALVAVLKPYNISRSANFLKVLQSSLATISVHILLVFAYYVFQQEHRYSRELLVKMYGAIVVLTISSKSLFYLGIKWARKRGWNYRNVIIVSSEEDTGEVEGFIKEHPEYGYHIIAVLKADDLKQRAHLEELMNYCLKNGIHEIFYTLSGGHYTALNDLINFAEDHLIKVVLLADFKSVGYRDLAMERFGLTPVLRVHTTPLDRWDRQLVKRAFDVAFSLVVICLVLSWLIPILGLLIYIDNRGPVFFKQQRTGQGNKTFWCYKLRTMVVNRESDQLQATKNDPRITRIGRLLRKSSLDELPQFLNVLIGNMSVVGPRPHMLKHTQDFSAELDSFMVRHQIKPGITGLAQSKGYRGETNDFEKKKNRVKLDLFYVRNWSLLMDVKIIFTTIASLFSGFGEENN